MNDGVNAVQCKLPRQYVTTYSNRVGIYIEIYSTPHSNAEEDTGIQYPVLVRTPSDITCLILYRIGGIHAAVTCQDVEARSGLRI